MDEQELKSLDALLNGKGDSEARDNVKQLPPDKRSELMGNHRGQELPIKKQEPLVWNDQLEGYLQRLLQLKQQSQTKPEETPEISPSEVTPHPEVNPDVLKRQPISEFRSHEPAYCNMQSARVSVSMDIHCMTMNQLHDHIEFLLWQIDRQEETILKYRRDVSQLQKKLDKRKQVTLIPGADFEFSKVIQSKSLPQESKPVIEGEKLEDPVHFSPISALNVTSSPLKNLDNNQILQDLETIRKDIWRAPLTTLPHKEAAIVLGVKRSDEPLLSNGLPPIIRESPGYVIENGSTSTLISKDFAIDNVLFYQFFFIGHDHVNLLCRDTPSGPAIISVLKGDENYRILLRTKEGDQQAHIPRSKIDRGWKSTTSRIVKEISPLFATCKWIVSQDQSLKDELMDFECRMVTKKFKVGILLALDAQIREEEMFSNEHPTPAFQEFLDFLGDKIELQGWKGFSGGLDTKSGTTGQYSLHRAYLDNEVMFHVSTFLPFSTADPQQVERKRHLGNDIVLIVFLDGNTPFRPGTISSHFIHIVFVVQPVEVRDGRVTKYRLEVMYKDTVSDFGPPIPDPPIFHKNAGFLDFLYAKIINAELACYRSEQFVQKLQQTREVYLQNIIHRFSK